MAQLISITSEALQSTVRRLLPSQQGFGEDLQATNVVTPIIDLTPTAEGSILPIELQTALAFDSQTAYIVENSTVTVVNTPGFYRIFGTFTYEPVNASPDRDGSFDLSDGSSSKRIFGYSTTPNANTGNVSFSYDFIVFMRAGDTLSATTVGSGNICEGSSRQIADVNGVLIDPAGFVSQ